MGQIIKAVIDGEDREFEVISGDALGTRTHYLNQDSTLLKFGIYGEVVKREGGLFLRLIQPTHQFGPILYEETGETRIGQIGEWQLGLGAESPMYVFYVDSVERLILRPVSIEEQL